MKRAFDNIRIREMELRNRLMMSAMVTNYCGPGGEVTDRLVAYHKERAGSGVALIETEAAYVHPTGKGYANQLGNYKDELVPGLKRLVEIIHAHDTNAMIQLHHTGRRTSEALTGHEVISPSAVACYEGDTPPKWMIIAKNSGGTRPREMTLEDIQHMVECFGTAARRAVEAGFDAVSIHAAHGYLVGSFVSPFTNKRQDEYGGDLQGRCRFLLEIIHRVRNEVESLPIVVKINGEEFLSGGISLDYAKEVAALIEKAGADAIIVSAGTVGQTEEGEPFEDLEKEPYTYLRTLPMCTPRGVYRYLARGVKERVTIPVIAVGRINTPETIRDILKKGDADMVALGRAFLADPYFPKKMEQGNEEEIRTCIACNQGCFENLFQQLPITCMINPRTGRESEWKFDPVVQPKKVLIIGGGPAGMEAAGILTGRGHSITLCERSDHLGGQLRIASKAPSRGELENYIHYLIARLEALSVNILMKCTVTPALIKELAPEVVIFATGASPLIPDFLVSDGGHVVTAEKVLLGQAEVGENVIIAGGGLVGCEVAEFLAVQGERVTVVEMGEDIVPGAFSDNRKYFENLKARHGIHVLTGATIKSIDKGSVVIEKESGEQETLKGDTVVLALGYISNAEVMKEVPISQQQESYQIGDCVRPRRAIDAIYEAYELANSL